MTFNDYQKEAAKTANRTNDALSMGALGLAGEAGEVVDLIKKHLYHGHPLDKDKLTREIGDLAWYCAFIATVVGIEFDDVATTNLAKLKARYGDAFSVEKSINRAEGDN